MAHLQDILYKVSIRSVHGELGKEVDNLQTDSRLAGPGTLFIAVKGTHADGHQFIPQVITASAATPIICEELPASPHCRSDLCTGRKLGGGSRHHCP